MATLAAVSRHRSISSFFNRFCENLLLDGDPLTVLHLLASLDDLEFVFLRDELQPRSTIVTDGLDLANRNIERSAAIRTTEVDSIHES